MEQEKNSIEQQVKLEMQDAEYATAENYRISWTASEARRLDTKRLKEEQPEVYDQYCKVTKSRRFQINAA